MLIQMFSTNILPSLECSENESCAKKGKDLAVMTL